MSGFDFLLDFAKPVSTGRPERSRAMRDLGEYLEGQLEYVRSLSRESFAEIRRLEHYALIGTIAIWSWLAGDGRIEQYGFMAWFPVVLTALFGIRAYGHYQYARAAAGHLREIEIHIGVPMELRWDQLETGILPRLRVHTGFAFWIALFGLTFGLATDHQWFRILL